MPFVQGLFGPPNVEKMKAKRDVKGLIKALSYKKDSGEWEDDAVREVAAKALGVISDASAVEPLITTLEDSNGAVRWTAAEALGVIGDSRAVEPLIAKLHDDNDRVRKEATEALGKIGKPAAEPLIAALKYDNWKVRYAATELLGKIRDARGVEPLIAALKDDNWRVRVVATEVLGKMGDSRAVEPLIAVLKDSELPVRSAAVNALYLLGWFPGTDENGARYWSLKDEWDKCIEIGTQAVDPLITRLKDGAWKAIESLGKIGDARAVEPLLSVLKHINWAWRKTAANALGMIGDTRAVEPLIDVLKDDTWDVREAAAVALGAIDDARAVEPLIAVLKDFERVVRAEAETLLKSKDMHTILSDSKRAVHDAARRAACEAAVDALGKLGDSRAIAPLITALDNYMPKAATEALVKIGKPAVEPLITELNDNNRHVPELIIEVLCKIGDTRAVEPLIVALHDPNDNVRKVAARALSMIGDVRAIEPLTSDRLMPEAMVEGLGMIGDTDAIASLIFFLKNPDVERRAAEVLEKIGAPAVEPLCMALKEDALALPHHPPKSPLPGAYVEGGHLYWERVRVRKSIAGILGNIADARAAETLTWISKNDPAVVDMLENEEIAARDDRWPVRETATDALEKIADSGKMKLDQ